MVKIMALNTHGGLSYCTVSPHERGKGRCNHVSHQEENESVNEFVERVSNDHDYGKNFNVPVVSGEMSIEQYKMTDEEKEGLVMILGRKQLEEDIDGGYIELAEPLWNDMDKSSFSEISGIPMRDINEVLNKNKYIITDMEVEMRGLEVGKVITKARMDLIEEKSPDLVQYDTGVVALNNLASEYGFEATRDVYVLPYYLRQDPPGDGAKNPLNTLYNFMIVKRKNPDAQQQAYSSLLNNSASVKPLTQRGGYAIPSLAEKFKGKSGVMRAFMSGRSIKYSGRAVITPEQMEYGVAKLPASMAANIFKPSIEDYLQQKGNSPEKIKLFMNQFRGIDQADIPSESKQVLNQIVKNLGVRAILNRQPSLHEANLIAFRPEISEDATIKINPLNLPGYNGDIDGDTMSIFAINDVEISRKADREIGAEKMTHMPRHKETLITRPTKESLWGLYNVLSQRKQPSN